MYISKKLDGLLVERDRTGGATADDFAKFDCDTVLFQAHVWADGAGYVGKTL